MGKILYGESVTWIWQLLIPMESPRFDDTQVSFFFGFVFATKSISISMSALIGDELETVVGSIVSLIEIYLKTLCR